MPHPLRAITLALGLLALVATPLAFGMEPLEAPVEAVPAVDLNRYAGLWYEVARLPNRFQDGCGCCVTATNTLRGDGRLRVVNECRTTDGEATAVEGEAKLAEEAGPTSKLKVRFAPGFLSFLGFVWGDYWVLDLDPDYSRALVGSPDRKYLWVLSRQPRMAEETYAGLLKEAAGMGYDVSRVRRTAQEDSSVDRRSGGWPRESARRR